MRKLIIEEYVNQEVYFRKEIIVADFQHATEILVKDLWNTSDPAYAADVLRKWFGGPPVVGEGRPFNVRQYDGPVGHWTDFLYRP